MTVSHWCLPTTCHIVHVDCQSLMFANYLSHRIRWQPVIDVCKLLVTSYTLTVNHCCLPTACHIIYVDSHLVHCHSVIDVSKQFAIANDYIIYFIIHSKYCQWLYYSSLKKYTNKILAIIRVTIFTNPSAQAGYDTRSILKRSLTGLNSEFSFS